MFLPSWLLKTVFIFVDKWAQHWWGQRQRFESVDRSVRDEQYFRNIFLRHFDLVVSRECVKKLSSRCPAIASINWSMVGRGYQSLGHASLRLVQSIQVLHFSLAFFNQDDAGQPFGVLELAHENNFECLVDLVVYGSLSLGGMVRVLLLDRASVGVNP